VNVTVPLPAVATMSSRLLQRLPVGEKTQLVTATWWMPGVSWAAENVYWGCWTHAATERDGALTNHAVPDPAQLTVLGEPCGTYSRYSPMICAGSTL
jgi:hypothetical protein